MISILILCSFKRPTYGLVIEISQRNLRSWFECLNLFVAYWCFKKRWRQNLIVRFLISGGVCKFFCCQAFGIHIVVVRIHVSWMKLHTYWFIFSVCLKHSKITASFFNLLTVHLLFPEGRDYSYQSNWWFISFKLVSWKRSICSSFYLYENVKSQDFCFLFWFQCPFCIKPNNLTTLLKVELRWCWCVKNDWEVINYISCWWSHYQCYSQYEIQRIT